MKYTHPTGGTTIFLLWLQQVHNTLSALRILGDQDLYAFMSLRNMHSLCPCS